MSIHTHFFSFTFLPHRCTNATYTQQYTNVLRYLHIISTAPTATRKRASTRKQHLGDELVEHFQLRAVLHQMLALDERRPCICMYVCMHVCMYTYIYLYMLIYIYTNKHTHTQLQTRN